MLVEVMEWEKSEAGMEAMTVMEEDVEELLQDIDSAKTKFISDVSHRYFVREVEDVDERGTAAVGIASAAERAEASDFFFLACAVESALVSCQTWRRASGEIMRPVRDEHQEHQARLRNPARA